MHGYQHQAGRQRDDLHAGLPMVAQSGDGATTICSASIRYSLRIYDDTPAGRCWPATIELATTVWAV